MPDEYTLSELSNLSGEPVRRTRSYIQQDLLPGPTTAGRNAKYLSATLDRLLAIKRLRSIEGLSIAEVRIVLSRLGVAQIHDLGKESAHSYESRIQPSRRRSVTRGASGQNPDISSALEYLQDLNLQGTETQFSRVSNIVQPEVKRNPRHLSASGPAPEDDSEPTMMRRIFRRHRTETDPTPDTEVDPTETLQAESALHRLLSRLGEAYPSSRVQRKARAEEWMKIPVTVDIELHVRKEFGDSDRATLELLADYIREAMTGGI